MQETRDRSHDAGQFVGSAVVAGGSYGPQSTLLRLKTFAGEYIDYRVSDVPDPAGIAALHGDNLHPISVKIQEGGQRCSVVALASGGPRSLTVTLGTALALYKSGVHAVVDGGLQIGVPCLIRNKPRTALRRSRG
jgi:hypothetical protein